MKHFFFFTRAEIAEDANNFSNIWFASEQSRRVGLLSGLACLQA